MRNVHVIEPPAWVTDNALLVRIREGFAVDYLAAVLQAEKLNALAAQTAQPLLTGEVVKRCRVPLLSMSDQAGVMHKVNGSRSVTTQVINRLGRQIALLREHRQALITAAVTGELDLPGVAA